MTLHTCTQLQKKTLKTLLPRLQCSNTFSVYNIRVYNVSVYNISVYNVPTFSVYKSEA